MVAVDISSTILGCFAKKAALVRACVCFLCARTQDTMQFQVVKSRPATFIPWTPVNPFPDPDRAEVACVLYPRFFDGPSPLVSPPLIGQGLRLS